MLKEVESRLRDVYNAITNPVSNVVDVFVQQFGEEFVDCDIMTFDALVEKLKNETLRSMGVTNYVAANTYGSYTIDTDDYAQNGTGKKFLEYIPDLNIINFVTPALTSIIFPNTTIPIIIYFPKVRVTNENDKFVDIDDLYVRVTIDRFGKLTGCFEMIRGTYTFAQFNSGYAHSHLPRVDVNNITKWKNPCLGTGPIRDTINTLWNINDPNIWGLFAFELSKYVTIESLAGIPYIRLESIKETTTANDTNLYYISNMSESTKNLLDKFIIYCAKHKKFKIRYVDGEYRIGENPVQAIINLSNTFIDWYDNHENSSAVKPSFHDLKERQFLKECVIANNHIYELRNGNGRDIGAALRVNNTALFKFKGNTVRLNIITNTSVSSDNISYILSDGACGYVFSRVLTIINYKYGRSEKQGDSESQENEAGEKLLFI